MDKALALQEVEYKGHWMTLLAESWTVQVRGPHLDDETFATKRQAEDAIDEAVKKAARNEQCKINLPAMTADGTEVAIKGLHATQDRILTTPPIKGSRYNSEDLYPRAAWILQAHQRKAALEREIESIEERLDAVKITAPSPRGGWNRDAMSFETRLAALQTNYQRVRRIAAETENTPGGEQCPG